MMDKTLAKQTISDSIIWKTARPKGGQTVGLGDPAVTLICEDLDIEITIGCHRSQLKNKELAYTLFELAFDEVVK